MEILTFSNIIFFISLMYVALVLGSIILAVDLREYMNDVFQKYDTHINFVYYLLPVFAMPLFIANMIYLLYYKRKKGIIYLLHVIVIFPIIVMSMVIYASLWYYTARDISLFAMIRALISSDDFEIMLNDVISGEGKM